MKRAFHVTLGKMLQSAATRSSDVVKPYLRAANIQPHGIDLSDIREMHFDRAELDRYRLEKGDLLVSEGGDVGRAARWETDAEMFFQNAINRVRGRALNSTHYLYYWLTALKAVGYLDLVTDRATIAHLTAEKLKEIPVALPRPTQQRAIASFLDRETARIDSMIAKKERLIELLEEKRTALITRAVTKGLDSHVPMKDSGVEWLGEVPGHWEVKRLKFCSARGTGSIQIGPFGTMLKAVSYTGGQFKVFGQENVISGDFSAGDRWITADQWADLRKYEARAGDLLFTRKGSLGNCSLFPSDAARGIIDSDTIRVRLDEVRIDSRFLVRVLHEATYSTEQMVAGRRGAVLGGLNSESIADLILAVPPLTEQRVLVRFMDAMAKGLNALAVKVRRAIELHHEHRTALISAAVTGQIEVPAS